MNDSASTADRRRHPLFRSCLRTGLLLIGVLVLTASCSSVSHDDMITAAGLVIVSQLNTDFRTALDSWWGVTWAEGSEPETYVDNDRMPAWAADTYDACVYWARAFETRETVRRQGPDLIRVRSGIGWGWILINRKLEVHIAETGFDWRVLENDVEVQTKSRIVVDAWDPPEDS